MTGLPARLLGFFLILVAILVAIGVCYSKNAKAQTYPEDFPPGEDQITALAQGERAPFGGQLFSTDTAIRWGFRLQSLRFRLDADLDRERSICVADTELLSRRLELEEQRSAFRLQILQDALAESRSQLDELSGRLAEGTPWYRTWEFGFGVGVLATAVLVGLTAWALSSV